MSNLSEINELFLNAATSGLSSEIFRLLGCGADVNATNRVGNTALHQCSVGVCDLSVVKQLLDAGALINSQNEKGETPLHLATKKTNTVLAKMLIDRGAEVNLQNSFGDTPLHLAFIWGNSEDSRMFIESGANLNVQNSRGDTPLHVACRHSNCTQLVNILIENGACLDSLNESKETPLHLATHFGNYTIANILLKSKAKTDVQNIRGDTPLHVVARFDRRFCDKPIATDLLNRGARVDIKNNDNKTPFDLGPLNSAIKIAIKEHITKLKLLNFAVDITYCTENELLNSNFAKKCLKELEIIRSTKFDKDCTLDIVFVKMGNPYYLRGIDRMEMLESVLYSTFLVDQFPLYAFVLRHTYEKTKTRFNLLTSAAESLSHPNRLKIFRNLPDLVREKILIQLKDEDLENILKSEVEERE